MTDMNTDDTAKHSAAGDTWRLAMQVWNAMDERHMGLIAAGVAFYTMFAIFPGMAATIAIWGVFGDPSVMHDYLEQIHGVIPDAAYGVLKDQLDALIAANTGSIGWTTYASLGVALYSVHGAVASLVNGLNAIHARGHRVGMLRVAASLLLTLAVLGLGLAALATVVFVPLILNFMHLGHYGAFVLVYLPWVVLFLALFILLGLFYRWGPTSESRDLRHSWASPGAFVAALLWIAASIAFSVYLTYFGAYNRIYGSIGAIIALLTWLYISAYILLFGAVLNAERARMRQPQ